MSTDEQSTEDDVTRSSRRHTAFAQDDRTSGDEPPLLEVRGLKTHFPVNTGLFDSIRLDRGRGAWPFRFDDSSVRAVDGVDLALQPGETLGVVGESGCGKSTLARTVLGLEAPTDGEIRFDGRPVAEISEGEFRERTQMVFQDPQSSLNPRRKVGSIIEDPLRGTDWPSTDPSVAVRTDLRTERLEDFEIDAVVPDDADLILDPVDGVVEVPVTVRRASSTDTVPSTEPGQNGDGRRDPTDSDDELPGFEDELRVDIPWGFDADVHVDEAARTIDVTVSVSASTEALRRNRALELLEQVGLKREYYNRYPHEFSGGQRQRINLARALSINPDLVVADEPVSGLDVSVQAQILNLMDDVQEAYGLTYLVISHDLSVVRYLADRVAVMYLGEFVELAPTEELFAEQHHPYANALLRSVPNPDPDQPGVQSVISGAVPSASDPPRGCRFHTRCPAFILPEGFTVEGYEGYDRLLGDVRDRTLEADDPDAVADVYITEPDGVPPTAVTAVGRAAEQALAGEWEVAQETLEVHESICQSTAPELELLGGDGPAGGSERVAACHLETDERSGDREP